jgi:hypothetical protein
MIEAEIGGYPPIPLAQNMGFHLGIFSIVFFGPKLSGSF